MGSPSPESQTRRRRHVLGLVDVPQLLAPMLFQLTARGRANVRQRRSVRSLHRGRTSALVGKATKQHMESHWRHIWPAGIVHLVIRIRGTACEREKGGQERNSTAFMTRSSSSGAVVASAGR